MSEKDVWGRGLDIKLGDIPREVRIPPSLLMAIKFGTDPEHPKTLDDSVVSAAAALNAAGFRVFPVADDYFAAVDLVRHDGVHPMAAVGAFSEPLQELETTDPIYTALAAEHQTEKGRRSMQVLRTNGTITDIRGGNPSRNITSLQGI